MKASVAKLWVAALRSGKYKQGRNQLRNGDNFCCLGVLCDVYHQETGRGKWFPGIAVSMLDSNTGVLPPSVQKWAGMASCNGASLLLISSLVTLNDTMALTFPDIANYIETNAEKL